MKASCRDIETPLEKYKFNCSKKLHENEKINKSENVKIHTETSIISNENKIIVYIEQK